MELKEIIDLKQISHQHPLILIDLQLMYQDYLEDDDDFSDNDLIKTQNFNSICDRCSLRIDWYHRYYYKCSVSQCDYSLHRFCAEIPINLNSPSHPNHTLFLKKVTKTNWSCDGCLADHKGGNKLCYHCSTCNYRIDLSCATYVKQNTVHHPGHPHPLIAITNEQISIKCFACGMNHEGHFYHCIICFKFSINSKCLSLPMKLLKKEFHSHPLTLSYSFMDQQYGSRCRLCHKEFQCESWLFKCSKCMYYMHLNCGEMGTMWFLKNFRRLPGTIEEIEKLLHPCPVFPRHHESFNLQYYKTLNEETKAENGCLDDRSIHEHPLVLIRNDTTIKTNSGMSLHDPMKGIKLLCNGCVRPITKTPFYKCASSSCSNFVIHEQCTRMLTELLDHPYHQSHKLVLVSNQSLFSCKACQLPCNGFAYSCETCKDYKIDVNCGLIPREIIHEAYPRHLSTLRDSSSRSLDRRLTCHACHSILNIEPHFYASIDDQAFNLHHQCALSLPKTIRHKYDKHFMELCYSPIENHKGQYFCEVCEEGLNPEKWFYHCRTCAQSIHTACAPLILKSEQDVNSSHDHDFGSVYKFINMKFGDVRRIEDHSHPVSFIAGSKSDGVCTKCEVELKSKFILKCLECDKFAIHNYCESFVTEGMKQQLESMLENLEKRHSQQKTTIQVQTIGSFYPRGIMIRPTPNAEEIP